MYKSLLSNNGISFYETPNVPTLQIISENVENKRRLKFNGQSKKITLPTNTRKKKKTVLSSEILNTVLLIDLGNDDIHEINITVDNPLSRLNFTNGTEGDEGHLILNITGNKTLNFTYNDLTSNIHFVNEDNLLEFTYNETTIYEYKFVNSNIYFFNMKGIVSSLYEQINTNTHTVFTYEYLSDVQTLTLPSNVNTFTASCWGGGGNNSYGGYVKSTVSLPIYGATLYIVIGKKGDSTYGGGSSIIYYNNGTEDIDILIAGGGGNGNDGGGLVAQGIYPGSQINGNSNENLYSGNGQSDSSGSGYYAGTYGSGGSNFIGSNINIVSFDNVHNNYTSLMHFDILQSIIYTYNVSKNSRNMSSYYHNNVNDGLYGSDLNDGFVEIIYENDDPNKKFGIDYLTYSNNVLIPTFNEFNYGNYWKYIVIGNKSIKTQGVLMKSSNLTYIPLYSGSYTFYAYSTDVNGLNVYGEIQSQTFIYNNEITENLNTTIINNHIQITNSDITLTDYPGGHHYKIIVHDLNNSTLFSFRQYDLNLPLEYSNESKYEVYAFVESINFIQLSLTYFGNTNDFKNIQNINTNDIADVSTDTYIITLGTNDATYTNTTTIIYKIITISHILDQGSGLMISDENYYDLNDFNRYVMVNISNNHMTNVIKNNEMSDFIMGPSILFPKQLTITNIRTNDIANISTDTYIITLGTNDTTYDHSLSIYKIINITRIIDKGSSDISITSENFNNDVYYTRYVILKINSTQMINVIENNELLDYTLS